MKRPLFLAVFKDHLAFVVAFEVAAVDGCGEEALVAFESAQGADEEDACDVEYAGDEYQTVAERYAPALVEVDDAEGEHGGCDDGGGGVEEAEDVFFLEVGVEVG